MSKKRDYYEVLGVSKSASEQEIKKAYRTLAKQYHPDKLKDGSSDAKMQELNEAYEVLSDSTKRSNYDQFGHDGVNGNAGFGGGGHGFGGFEGFGDIFENIFGGFGFGGRGRSRKNQPLRGDDTKYIQKISFMQSLKGDVLKEKLYKYETCLHCSGSGADSSKDIKNCDDCSGSGYQVKTVNSFFGRTQQQVPCSTCNGKGKIVTKKCSICKGNTYEKNLKTVNIPIPQGVENGTTLKLQGYGNPGVNGGPAGDMYIQIEIEPNKYFERKGATLFLKYPVSIVDVLLEKEVVVPGAFGDFKIKLKKEYTSGQTIKVPGKGVVSKYETGDLKIILDFVIPKMNKKDMKKVVETFQTIEDETNTEFVKSVNKSKK